MNPLLRRKTKIIATLGPACGSAEQIGALIAAGVNVFRINFSHIKDDAGRDEAAAWVASIRAEEAQRHQPIAIFADLQGPKLRLGTMRRGGVALRAGQIFSLDTDPAEGDMTRAPLLHPEIYAALQATELNGAGQILKLNDGFVTLRVREVRTTQIACEVIAASVHEPLTSYKGVNVPGVRLPISALTDKDRDDLRHALELGVDFIAQSFVQTADDVAELRRLIGTDDTGKSRAGIIAKIEKPLAVQNIAAIADLADALMIARGDLGVEVDSTELPRMERALMLAGKKAQKPVILATQVLASMVRAPQPSRAELSGIEHAVFEGADAVMLSNETAVGEFPLEAVWQLHESLRAAETDAAYPLRSSLIRQQLAEVREGDGHELPVDWVIDSKAEQDAGITAIVAYTASGATARRLSRMHPAKPVLTLTPYSATARRLTLAFGIFPAVSPDCASDADIVRDALARAQQFSFAAPGGRILILWGGYPPGRPGATNSVTLQTLHASAAPDPTSCPYPIPPFLPRWPRTNPAS